MLRSAVSISPRCRSRPDTTKMHMVAPRCSSAPAAATPSAGKNHLLISDVVATLAAEKVVASSGSALPLRQSHGASVHGSSSLAAVTPSMATHPIVMASRSPTGM